MSVIFSLESPYRGAWHLHRVSFGGPGRAAVAMVAGLHGHEVNGVHALNLVAGMLRVLRPRRPVHLLPCVNSIGAEEGRKRWPFDDRDINASFPGDPEGAAVERVAAAVMEATDAEVCVDVHSGAATVREHPHVRAPLSGVELEHARAMQLPVLWRRPAGRPEGGLIQAWQGAGRAALQARGGRGMALDVDDATALARGLVRLLAHLGVVGPQDPASGTIETEIGRAHV